MVQFDSDKCKGCSLCVAACPKKILRLSQTQLNGKGFHPAEVVSQDQCIACGFCAVMCPDSVITVTKP